MNDEHVDLKQLLEENLEVAKENQRLLKLIRRDAYVALAVKVVLYLVVLGVPIFFLSQYLGPLLSAMTAAGGPTPTSGFVLPSPEEIQLLKEMYGIE